MEIQNAIFTATDEEFLDLEKKYYALKMQHDALQESSEMVTRKQSITMPESDWEWVERVVGDGSRSEFFKEMVQVYRQFVEQKNN
ncbi:hypothetical protein D3C78_1710100 [compost metagenome]